MCQSAVSAFLRCRFVRELDAAKHAVLLDALHQTARSSAEAYQFRGWETVLPGIPASWAQDAPDLWNGHPCVFRWLTVPRRWTAGKKHDSAA